MISVSDLQRECPHLRVVICKLTLDACRMKMEPGFLCSFAMEGRCPECLEYKPDDERVQNSMKCAACAGYGG